MAVGALGFALFCFWSMLSPVFVPPDEVTHTDLVYFLAEGNRYPDYDDRVVGAGAYNPVLTHQAPLVVVDGRLTTGARTAANATPQNLWPTYAERGGSAPGTSAMRNQMPQHPPLYYQVMAGTLRVGRHLPGGGQMSMHTELHLLRVLNAALTASLPIIAWVAARRIGASDQAALTAAVLVLAVPQLTHIGSAINNDNLISVAIGLLTIPLISVLKGDLRKRTGALIGAITATAFLTKAFAIVLPVWILACYVVAIRRERDRTREGLTSLAVAGGLVISLSGWWWVRNLLRHGNPAPSIHATNPYSGETPAGFEPDLLSFVRTFAGRIVERFWGSFNSFHHALPTVVVLLASALAVIALAAAFVRRRPATDPGGVQPAVASRVRRSDLAMIGVISLLLLTFVFLRAWGLYAETGRHPFIQGRYLFGAVVALATIVAVGTERLVGRWAPLVALGAVLVMQGTGIYVGVTSLWGESRDSVSRSWSAFAAWNPGPVPLAPLVLGVVAALFAICAVLLAKGALDSPEPARAGRTADR